MQNVNTTLFPQWLSCKCKEVRILTLFFIHNGYIEKKSSSKPDPQWD